jgi:signal transduction histidine kinase
MQLNFVAGVSHELRTPLTVLHTAGYNLRGKLARDPGQVERYGALIQHESARLRDLVEQVLQFASGNAGGMVRDPEPMAVEGAVEAAIESAQPDIESARCVVEKRIEPGLPLILGDPVALKHAIQNVVGNAAKYGNGWIGVFASHRAGRDGSVVEIRVADRGPGIPSDEQAHVFDPFFRGKRALQDQIHGTGLGLSLAKGIVEAHGGAIEVHSEPGRGTEFVVRLPAAPKEYQDEFTNSVSGG